MQLGFSIIGVVFLAMLFVPNIRWAKNQPAGYSELAARENKTVLTLERIGQAATTCCAVVFVSPKGFSFPWILWLCVAIVCMALYETAWLRYFRNGEKSRGHVCSTRSHTSAHRQLACSCVHHARRVVPIAHSGNLGAGTRRGPHRHSRRPPARSHKLGTTGGQSPSC